MSEWVRTRRKKDRERQREGGWKRLAIGVRDVPVVHQQRIGVLGQLSHTGEEAVGGVRGRQPVGCVHEGGVIPRLPHVGDG